MTSFTLVNWVNPPLDLSLSSTSVSLTRGTAMTPITASATGGDGNYSFSIFPALPAGLSIDANTGTFSGTPTVEAESENYTVTVTDGEGGLDMEVLILSVSQPPLDLELSETSVSLTRGTTMTPVTATATGGDENYSFSVSPALPAGLAIDANTGTISGTPTVASGSTNYSVTVTDGTNTVVNATLDLGVDHPALDLSLSDSAMSLTRGTAMTPVTATATGGDEDYTFSVAPALPAGLTVDASSGEISGTPTEAAATTTYTVTVTDGEDATASATLDLGVDHPGLNLALSDSAVSLTRDTAMTPVTATATGGDEDYTFSVAPALPAGLTLDASSGEISGTPTVASATTTYTVTVTDGEGTTDTATLDLDIDHPPLGLALSDSAVSLTRDTAMTPVTATATGGDEDYTFSVAPALPAGLTLDASSGEISGMPTEAAATTTYTVTVTDGEDATASAALDLGVDHPGLNLALSDSAVSLTRDTAMTPVTAAATGGDEDYTFSVAPALPAGLTLDASSGEISGTPTEAAATTSYTVTVTDGVDATATATLDLGVDHPGLNLALSESAVSLTRDTAMTPVTATATGGDEDYTFSVAPALPAGLSIDADSGEISGTPTEAAATTSYTVTVTDGVDATATATLDLGVDHPGLNLALSDSAVSLTRDTAMTPVTATATGGDEDYTFSVSPALPAGLTLDASSGEISGTPSVASATSSYTVTVTDGEGTTDTAAVDLGVDHPALDLALSETSLTLTRGIAMAPVAATATGGDENYTFSIAPALPDGLTLDASSGEISGTPTEASSTETYTVTITDGEGTSAVTAVTLSVEHPDLTLALSTDSVALIRGTEMTAITAIASGGDENYRFSISPSLPAGLAFDPTTGTISGTPRTPSAARAHQVTVSDGSGGTASAALTLSIDEDDQHVVDSFTETTAAFVANRVDRILSAEPRGYRFNNRTSQGLRELAARADSETSMFRFSGNHVTPEDAWHFWAEGEFAGYRHGDTPATTQSGQFAMFSAGADYLVTPSLAFGVMAQVDSNAESNRDLLALSGDGWMVGPYLAGEISPSLFFSLRGAVGGSGNSASIDVYEDGSDRFTGNFRTDRALVRGALFGLHEFASGVVVSPEIELAWMRERQSGYTVTDGASTVAIPGGLTETGRLTIGTMVDVPVDDGRWVLYTRPTASLNSTLSGGARTQDLRGAVEFGFRTGGQTTWNATGSLRFDGLGSSGSSSESLSLTLSRRF